MKISFLSASRFLSKRAVKRAFWLVLGSWIVWTAVRSRRLLQNAEIIAAHSAHFERDYFVGNARQPSLTCLVMGDSTAAGWGAQNLESTYAFQIAQSVAGRGRYVRVVSIAVGGARLEDMLETQIPKIDNIRPQFITLCVGANDATHFTKIENYRRRMRILLQALEKSTARICLVANTPDMFQAPALPLPFAIAINQRARKQNKILDELLPLSPKLQLVDLHTRDKLIYRIAPDLYAADMFHPSSRGYKRWAKVFVETLGQKPMCHKKEYGRIRPYSFL